MLHKRTQNVCEIEIEMAWCCKYVRENDFDGVLGGLSMETGVLTQIWVIFNCETWVGNDLLGNVGKN